tara:strand:- start:246 stop:620 length:375 start_codon:yes stop_codon:yes gene_type:complete
MEEYLYVISFILLINFIYLFSLKSYVLKIIKNIQNQDIKINKFSFILSYLLISFGLYFFIIKPRKNVEDAFILGILVYGFYHLKNLSFLSKWDLFLGMIETLFGGISFYLTTYLTYKYVGIVKM